MLLNRPEHQNRRSTTYPRDSSQRIQFNSNAARCGIDIDWNVKCKCECNGMWERKSRMKCVNCEIVKFVTVAFALGVIVIAL